MNPNELKYVNADIYNCNSMSNFEKRLRNLCYYVILKIWLTEILNVVMRPGRMSNMLVSEEWVYTRHIMELYSTTNLVISLLP